MSNFLQRDILQKVKSPIKESLRRYIRWRYNGSVLSRNYLGHYQIHFPGDGFLNFFLKHQIQPDPSLGYVVKKYLKPDSFVIDVGANIGLSVCLSAAQLNPNAGRILALEPSALPRRFLKANTLLNHLSFVEILPLGAGAAPQKLELYSHACDGNRSSSILQDYVVEGAASTETIELTTLDALIETRGIPNLIKIDVEGFELDVLDGLDLKNIQAQTVIFIEVRHATVTTVIQRLSDANYNCRLIVNQQEVEVNQSLLDQLLYDNLAVTDILAVPKTIQ